MGVYLQAKAKYKILLDRKYSSVQRSWVGGVLFLGGSSPTGNSTDTQEHREGVGCVRGGVGAIRARKMQITQSGWVKASLCLAHKHHSLAPTWHMTQAKYREHTSVSKGLGGGLGAAAPGHIT